VPARADYSSSENLKRVRCARSTPGPIRAHAVKTAIHAHLQLPLSFMAGRLNDRFNRTAVTPYIPIPYKVPTGQSA
jgi:hypothetical protein